MSKVKDIPKINPYKEKPFYNSDCVEETFQMELLDQFKTKKPDYKHKPNFTFIDLFAGIGGFHLAASNLGGQCVFASEFDDNARKTYEANFLKHNTELFHSGNFAGDITEVNEKNIPNFDFLFAGFPCQPFSQAGFKKGFSETRGTLFFNIVKIIQEKQPNVFFLENVRGLLRHDDDKTFATIKKVITKKLGYSFFYKIIKASDFGLPQHRPRLFMVGFKDKNIKFKFPEAQELKITMSDIWNGYCPKKIGYTLRVGGRGSKIDDRRNWDSYVVDGNIKKISSNEGKKMQGLPNHFIFPVSETQAMKQLGNSVAVPAIQAVIKQILKKLKTQ
ncbi:DNA-cytosine methyltransferase (EC 2.1.1.37) [uncultured Gammaproteobacteria bacterium]|nr:DNA-cytosine methyltransferase (EC 2.1.1.37) [uncultured Gammaproteobacteria bacterium]SHE21449.1 DNA-cytosine methyltransferase [Bathymodiolus brooksi thiotrophic gill symbiont]